VAEAVTVTATATATVDSLLISSPSSTLMMTEISIETLHSPATAILALIAVTVMPFSAQTKSSTVAMLMMAKVLMTGKIMMMATGVMLTTQRAKKTWMTKTMPTMLSRHFSPNSLLVALSVPVSLAPSAIIQNWLEPSYP